MNMKLRDIRGGEKTQIVLKVKLDYIQSKKNQIHKKFFNNPRRRR